MTAEDKGALVVRAVLKENRVHISQRTGAVSMTLTEWHSAKNEIDGQILDQAIGAPLTVIRSEITETHDGDDS